MITTNRKQELCSVALKLTTLSTSSSRLSSSPASSPIIWLCPPIKKNPFPHATITHTACHYPQDIVFRWLTLPAGSFVHLLYFSVFRYVELLKQRSLFPLGTEQWLLGVAQASVLGFYGAVGTIDGSGYPIIHLIGSIFFLYLVAGAVTIVLHELHNWDATVINSKSLLLKRIIVGYITGVALYLSE